MKPVVVTLTGPSCSGKSFLERGLAGHGYGRAVSHTTRPPRDGEVNGVHYHFISTQDFEELRESEAFVEEVEFGPYLYGMTIDSMNEAMKATGKMVVVAETVGAAQIREFCDDKNIGIVSVWVACDIEEQMQRFVEERIPGMTSEQIVKRLTLMATTEQAWRKSAEVGRINGAPYRYHMEMWKAGPEMEAIYIEGITRRVEREGRAGAF